MSLKTLHHRLLSALVVFVFSGSSIVLAETGKVDDRLTFYTGANFTGDSFDVEGAGAIDSLNSRKVRFFNSLTGFPSGSSQTWDKLLSSVELNGSFRVTLYTERDFKGTSRSFTTSKRSLTNLGGLNFDNRVRSLSWEPLGDGEGTPRVIFYNRPNFVGDSFFLYPGDNIEKLKTKRRNSRTKNWNDEIRSVRVVGLNTKTILYTETGYRGRRVTIIANARSLSEIGFSASVSGVKVLGPNQNP